jgi:hypothetical protein
MSQEYDGVATLLEEATETRAGESVPTLLFPGAKTFQATVVGTGAVTAEVKIEASNDDENWLVLGTITLTGSGSASDGFASAAAWAHHRANLTAVTGTEAAVTVKMAA